jgi:hypothetical protein
MIRREQLEEVSMRRVLIVSGMVLLGGSAFADGKSCVANEDCSAIERCDTEASASCNDAGVCAPRGINIMCMLRQRWDIG